MRPQFLIQQSIRSELNPRRVCFDHASAIADSTGHHDLKIDDCETKAVSNNLPQPSHLKNVRFQIYTFFLVATNSKLLPNKNRRPKRSVILLIGNIYRSNKSKLRVLPRLESPL